MRLILKFLMLIILTNQLYAFENKIIIKVNNEIVTSVDLLNEIRYLEILNNEFSKVKKEEAYEIAKKSIIKEKVKKIELMKLLKELELEESLKEKIIKDYFARFGIDSISKFEEFFIKKKLSPEYVKKKITIEVLWNQLIYSKYHKNLNISEDLIRKELLKKEKKNEYLISEILFNVEKNEKLEKKFNLIKQTISEKNFSKAALIYSISDSAKNGGKIGWIKESSISKKIKDEIIKTKIGNITNPIIVPGGFLIIKINDIRETSIKLDFEKEINLIKQKQTNTQLNQFSNLYFNKIKKNILINEL